MTWHADWLQAPVGKSGRELSFRNFLLFVHLPALAFISIFAPLCVYLANFFVRELDNFNIMSIFAITTIIFGTILSIFCSFVFYIFSIFIIIATTKSGFIFSSIFFISRKLFALYTIYIALSPMTVGLSAIFFLVPIGCTGYYLSKTIARFSDFTVSRKFPSISLQFSVYTIIFIISTFFIIAYLTSEDGLYTGLALMCCVAAVGFIACFSIWLKFERPKPTIQQKGA